MVDRSRSRGASRVGCRDRGQALPLVTLVVVAGVIALVLVVRVAGVVTDRARARTAADAAALAGAAGGRERAEAVAERNGGVVDGWVSAGGEVEVRVIVGEASATARARRTPAWEPAREAGSEASG